MDDPLTYSIAYLAARGDAPWRWTDDGDVIAWGDGTTIAFREEVAFILEWLIPHGWPPFGAIVWLLAACRGKLPPVVLSSDEPRPVGARRRMSAASLPDRIREMQATVNDGLAAIARLPDSMRTSPRAKAVLAEAVFGNGYAPALDLKLCQAVVAILRSGMLTDEMLTDPGTPPREGMGEFSVLYAGLREFSPESLVLRLRTGLDALPQAAALPVAPAARMRAMLVDLRADPEHAGLARVARDFMAALQLPRTLSEPDEMPIGGFADISNRGNLDRLLLSELAHDDLTLAVRIALQEALYLRREPPVKQPPSTLAVLLDSGVRLWGVPRLLAAAVALALIGKSAHHGQLSVFRAGGATLVPVDLLSREGLTAHLEALDSHAHPGLALPAFQHALEDSPRHDAVLITHRDVLGDPAFRRTLLASKFDTLYLAVVDRDGSFQLLRHPHTAAPLCRAQVNVDDLFPAPPSSVSPRPSLIEPALDREMPLILLASPFPLLLPVRGRVQATVETAEGGGACVLRDRRLMHWQDRAYGALTVAADLPRGTTLWLGEVGDGNIGLLKASGGRRRVSCRVFAVDGTPVRIHDWLLPDTAQRAVAHGGVLFVVCTREARAYDLKSGEWLGSVKVSRRFSHGRYFCTTDGWQLLVWDGQSLMLEPVFLRAPEARGAIVRVFSRRGCEGPWCVTHKGDVLSHDGICVLRLGPIRGVVRVSPNGDRLLAAVENSDRSVLADLRWMTQRVVTEVLPDHDWHAQPQRPERGMRTRFTSIAVSPGRIQLVSRNGTRWEIVCENDATLVLKGYSDPYGLDEDFESVSMPGVCGFSMKVARWSDGRRAWLDDRGMLHLRCADRHPPEVSIVLCEGALAAWSSDGLWCGPKFFIGQRAASPARELWERIEEFTG